MMVENLVSDDQEMMTKEENNSRDALENRQQQGLSGNTHSANLKHLVEKKELEVMRAEKQKLQAELGLLGAQLRGSQQLTIQNGEPTVDIENNKSSSAPTGTQPPPPPPPSPGAATPWGPAWGTPPWAAAGGPWMAGPWAAGPWAPPTQWAAPAWADQSPAWTNQYFDFQDLNEKAKRWYVQPNVNSSSPDKKHGKRSKDSNSSNTGSICFSDDTDEDYHDHVGDSRQYLRDMILGVNDGLVSTFLLVAAVAGGGLSTTDILLTAVAGAIAGAVSMCAGEFVATKSQNEVMEGEIALEAKHVKEHKASELRQVNDLLQIIGITDEQHEIQQLLHKHYDNDSDALLKLMVALEFGIIEEEKRSPVMAGIVSFGLFFVGSLPSVVPFAFTTADPTLCLIVASGLTCAALFAVGAVKTWATRGNWISAAVENLVIAGFGGGFAYVTGMLFGFILNDDNAASAI